MNQRGVHNFFPVAIQSSTIDGADALNKEIVKELAKFSDDRSTRERKLISIPLGKTQEGVPVPRHVSQSRQEGAETT